MAVPSFTLSLVDLLSCALGGAVLVTLLVTAKVKQTTMELEDRQARAVVARGASPCAAVEVLWGTETAPNKLELELRRTDVTNGPRLVATLDADGEIRVEHADSGLSLVPTGEALDGAFVGVMLIMGDANTDEVWTLKASCMKPTREMLLGARDRQVAAQLALLLPLVGKVDTASQRDPSSPLHDLLQGRTRRAEVAGQLGSVRAQLAKDHPVLVGLLAEPKPEGDRFLMLQTLGLKSDALHFLFGQ